MMSGGEIAGIILICYVILMGCLWVGHCDGRNDEKKKWQKDMIDRGLAQYNAKTGEWEWIEK